MPNPSPVNISKTPLPNRPKSPPKPLPPFKLVERLQALGFKRIIGVDEVGRGALSGPVVVAAVELTVPINGITDSKLIDRPTRRTLAEQIHAAAHQIQFGVVANDDIDHLGLAAALRQAYDQALTGLAADLILTDAYSLPGQKHCRAIHGDQLFYPVAAASIVAKVYRDQLMQIYHQFYPQYDWQNNVGYGTAKHLVSLAALGPSPLHRRSFLNE